MFHPVKEPKHYTGDGTIACMDALKSMIHEAPLSPIQVYWWGCAFKYLWRWPHKAGRQDLEKCKQCIDYLIAEVDDG